MPVSSHSNPKESRVGRISTAAHKPILVLLALQILPACAGTARLWRPAQAPGRHLHPPPPPSITVTVTPMTGSVPTWKLSDFDGKPSPTPPDTNVAWSVNGPVGGRFRIGRNYFRGGGTYNRRPPICRPRQIVQVTADEPSRPDQIGGMAQLTITSDLAITLAPSECLAWSSVRWQGFSWHYHQRRPSGILSSAGALAEPRARRACGKRRPSAANYNRPWRAPCSCHSDHNGAERLPTPRSKPQLPSTSPAISLYK